MRETLLHELCHVAAWVIDGCGKSCCKPHGPHFKKWCARGKSQYPHYGDFGKCHNYAIHKKFRYACQSKGGCGAIISRHSKSIDVQWQVCAACDGQLTLLGAFNRDGTAQRKRKPNQFALFNQKWYASVKKGMPRGTSHGAVMKKISAMYNDHKERSEAKPSMSSYSPASSSSKQQPAQLEVKGDDDGGCSEEVVKKKEEGEGEGVEKDSKVGGVKRDSGYGATDATDATDDWEKYDRCDVTGTQDAPIQLDSD